MEKWSNTAPCSCHALMSRIFLREREKEEKLQWSRKDKVLERRWMLRCEEGGRKKWAEGEFEGRRKGRARDRKEDYVSCMFGVAQIELARWFPWTGSDPRLERLLQAHYFILCPPPLSYHPSTQHLILPVCQIQQFSKWFANTSSILCHLKHFVSLWIGVRHGELNKCDSHVSSPEDPI